MLHRSLILVVGVVFSLNCFAQDVFILPAEEQTPSEQRQEKSALSADAAQNKNLTAYDQKKDVYEDLKYYFQNHEWISVGIDFGGYFDENALSYKKSEIDKYGNEILNSLPRGSYQNAEIRRTAPVLWFDIKKTALDSLYKNKAIIAIHIDRYATSEL